MNELWKVTIKAFVLVVLLTGCGERPENPNGIQERKDAEAEDTRMETEGDRKNREAVEQGTYNQILNEYAKWDYWMNTVEACNESRKSYFVKWVDDNQLRQAREDLAAIAKLLTITEAGIKVAKERGKERNERVWNDIMRNSSEREGACKRAREQLQFAGIKGSDSLVLVSSSISLNSV
jgi:hypothetical protein